MKVSVLDVVLGLKSLCYFCNHAGRYRSTGLCNKLVFNWLANERRRNTPIKECTHFIPSERFRKEV